MFYEVYCELCDKSGLTPSGAASKIGFNRASVTMWKNSGKAPKQDLLVKIADFFGVTTDYLLGQEEKEQPTVFDDGLSDVKKEFIQVILGLSDEKVQMLLQVAKSIK